MSTKSIIGSLCVGAFFLAGTQLFLPKSDPIPEGISYAGKGHISWKESTKTLTVFQETETMMLTIAGQEVPNIVHQSKIPGAKMLLRVENGNPSRIFDILRTEGNVMVINQNGLIVGADSKIDLPGDNQQFIGDDPKVIEMNGGKIQLGNFENSSTLDEKVSFGAEGTIRFQDIDSER